MATVSLLAESVVPASPGWMEWDVTNHVKDAVYNGFDNVDFILKPEDSNSTWSYIFMNSREDAENTPELVGNITVYANKDAQIRQQSPTTTYGSSSGLSIYVPYLSDSTIRRSIISFPVDGLTTNGTITLRIYVNSITDFAGEKIQVFKLTKTDWVESEVTWNSYKTGSAWTIAGGDYTDTGEVGEEPAPSSSGILRVGTQAFHSLGNDV